MSDPVERLRDFDPGPPVGSRSPAEIRRRGESLQRRRHGAMAMLAAGAVAAVVVPMLLLTGGNGRVAPVDPGPSSPTASVTPSETPSEPASSVPTPSSPSDPTSGPASVSPTIPDDYPLTQGWPDPADAEPGPRMGLTGPQADLEDSLFDYAACGQPLPVPPPAARLRAIYRNVEDTRTRQLLTFDDAQIAVQFMDELASFYRVCPEEVGGPQSAAFRRAVVPTGVGGQSYAMGGFPPVGQSVGITQALHAVRLGSAVLIDTTEGEGGGGEDLESLTRQRAELMTTNSSEVIGAMCLFTQAGC